MTEREVLDWHLFGVATRELAQSITADGFRPDGILTIARGGMLAAGALSYALDVKSIYLMNIMFYAGIEERLAAPVVLAPGPDVAALADANILIVDDVADTGGTLEVVRDQYASHLGRARCAVLYEKPQSTVKCDYVWRYTDRWVDFPWSSDAGVPAPRAH